MSFNFVHFATHAAGRWSEVGHEAGGGGDASEMSLHRITPISLMTVITNASCLPAVVLRKMSSAASSAASSAGSRSRCHFALIPQMKSYCCDFSAPSTLPFFLLMPWESILVTANNNNKQEQQQPTSNNNNSKQTNTNTSKPKAH